MSFASLACLRTTISRNDVNLGPSSVFAIQKRGKNKLSKIRQHMMKLDEMGHRQEKEAAQERRKKKKEKNEARKGKKGSAVADDEKDEDDDDEDEETEDGKSQRKKESRELKPDDDDDDEEFGGEQQEDDGLLPDSAQVKIKLNNILDSYKETIRKIRGAEPSPDMFDDVIVDAYGEMTPLKSLAQVVIASNTLAFANCYDPSTAKTVSNAIRNKLELNPSVEEDGVVKIPLPRVSMETRQNTAKLLNKKTERFRDNIREVRRHSMEIVKQGVAGKLEHVSKDDAFRVQQDIEKVVEDATQKLNQLAKTKHDAIMAVSG